MGDIVNQLAHIAKINNYELHGVHDAETGIPTASVNKTGGFGLLKGLAIAAGIAAADALLKKAAKT